MTDGLAAGELLTRDDWQRISDFMSPGQPIDRRVTAVVLCGKVGGEQAVTVLLQRLDDTERVAKEAVGSLQALVDQAAEQVLETIREPQSPLQQSRAFEVISASDSPKTLSSLLSLVLNSEDDSMRSDAQDAIFKIAYDEHADAIHPELFKYLLDPDRPEYEFVSELLVIVGDQAIGNLCGRLCDPTQTKLHAPILGILSSMGLQLARSSTRDQQRFEEMLKTLLGSTKSNEVKFALQILGCAEPDWAVRALANLCLVLTVPQRLRVVGYLKDLPSQAPADCEDVGIFVGQALEYLAEDPSRRVRRAARRVIDRL